MAAIVTHAAVLQQHQAIPDLYRVSCVCGWRAEGHFTEQGAGEYHARHVRIDTRGRPSWLEMRPAEFDAAEPLTLFDVTPDLDLGAKPKPDKFGTPDMFADPS